MQKHSHYNMYTSQLERTVGLYNVKQSILVARLVEL